MALFGSRNKDLRTSSDAVEFALDLTAEAIILHERAGDGGWTKFASARLDDPEFPMVIGLLRSDAEARIGGREPVRLWLPGEQVLARRAPIGETDPAGRLRAAFDHIERETIYRPRDVAVAVAPAGGGGEAALLITFAETWREARDYAARWGFIPGAVSTRHHAADFGAQGPVFRLNSHPPDPPAAARRRGLAGTALVLAAAVAAGAAAWSLRPWERPPGVAATPPRIAAAPASPDAPVTVPFPDAPVPSPDALATAPSIDAPAPLPSPDTLSAAPPPPPDPEPAPPLRDPVAAWTGPVPALMPPVPGAPPGAQAIPALTSPPARIGTVSLLAAGATAPPAPTAALPAEPPAEPPAERPAEPAAAAPNTAEPGEPADTQPAEPAGAALPVPIPLPRPVRADPDAPTEFAALTSPLPLTRPPVPASAARPGLPLGRTALVGIFNLDTGRKALLRLPDGRYRSVIVGDVLDGWRVNMIGADAMRITRSGTDRTFLLVDR